MRQISQKLCLQSLKTSWARLINAELSSKVLYVRRKRKLKNFKKLLANLKTYLSAQICRKNAQKMNEFNEFFFPEHNYQVEQTFSKPYSTALLWFYVCRLFFVLIKWNVVNVQAILPRRVNTTQRIWKKNESLEKLAGHSSRRKGFLCTNKFHIFFVQEMKKNQQIAESWKKNYFKKNIQM